MSSGSFQRVVSASLLEVTDAYDERVHHNTRCTTSYTFIVRSSNKNYSTLQKEREKCTFASLALRAVVQSIPLEVGVVFSVVFIFSKNFNFFKMIDYT